MMENKNIGTVRYALGYICEDQKRKWVNKNKGY